MALQRYKLTISYRGTRYHGWQKQTANEFWDGEGDEPTPGVSIPTIQESLIQATRQVVGHPIDIVGSSRTDAGVHAKGQVAHMDTTAVQIPRDGLRRAINARLPEDIVVTRLEPAPEWFNAITSTVCKRYQYYIWNDVDRPVFFGDLAWHRWMPLDVEPMKEACRHFVGEHDFASFARPGHGRGHSVRMVYSCSVHRKGKRVVLSVEGAGFLWNMVRIIVGTLVEIGMNKRPAGEIPSILAARDRKAAGPTAPPHGLYLQWIRMSPLAQIVAAPPRAIEETPHVFEGPVPTG